MPTIEFLENQIGRGKVVEAPQGGELVDLCDYHRAPVPFSCRSASCATCQIEVLKGEDLLEAPLAAELELLEILGGPPKMRLACQARVKPGPGCIQIRPIGF